MRMLVQICQTLDMVPGEVIASSLNMHPRAFQKIPNSAHMLASLVMLSLRSDAQPVLPEIPEHEADIP